MLQNEGKLQNCKFFEIDLPDVVQRKIAVILRSPTLCKLLDIHPTKSDTSTEQDNSNSSDTISNTEIHTKFYTLASADLNSIDELKNALKKGNIDFNVPTLFLSECVMIYLKPKEGDSVIKWASDHFPISSFCTYEQISPSDPFGLMMIQNLEKRGCPLLSIQKYPSIESQIQRYKDHGWEIAQCYNMFHIYNHFIDNKDKERAEKIEMLDELEEWRLIQEHYCIVWAFQCKASQVSDTSVIKLSTEIGFHSFLNNK